MSWRPSNQSILIFHDLETWSAASSSLSFFPFFFFFFLALPCSMWDLSSPARDGTLCSSAVAAQSLPGPPGKLFLFLENAAALCPYFVSYIGETRVQIKTMHFSWALPAPPQWLQKPGNVMGITALDVGGPQGSAFRVLFYTQPPRKY